MLLLNINVRDLILWNQQNGEPFFATTDSSEGGIVIFATIAGPDSNAPNNNYGVRVFGSADIPLPGGIGVSADPTGVTVATDQAMYVLGDFNRGDRRRRSAAPARLAHRRQRQRHVAALLALVDPGVCGANCCIDSSAATARASQTLANAARDAAEHVGQRRVPRRRRHHAAERRRRHCTTAASRTTRASTRTGAARNLTYQGSFVSLGTPEHVNGTWCGTGDSAATSITRPTATGTSIPASTTPPTCRR